VKQGLTQIHRSNTMVWLELDLHITSEVVAASC
jgi:hypothetical protein